MHDKKEKEFIHDLASPLSVAFIMVDGMLEQMAETPEHSNENLESLRRIMTALEQIQSIMASRRLELINNGGQD